MFVSPYLISQEEGRGFVLRGWVSTPEGSRVPRTGTVSLGWSRSHRDPGQVQGWHLGVLEWGQSAVTSNLAEMCVAVKEGKQR